MNIFSSGTIRNLNTLIAFLYVALCSPSLAAVDCTSDYIELNTQARIDSFQSDYGGGGTCDTVPGTLRIGGSDVVDLTPLSALTTIRDQFQIRQTNHLTDLEGLSALTSVGSEQTSAAGAFDIFDNEGLISLNGLSGLVSVGGPLTISDNPALTSLDGLSSLTSVSGLGIGNNDSLTDLSGISALVSGSVPWSIGIGGNDALTNLDGLSSLTRVGGSLSITHNYALVNLDGLSALTSVEREFDLRGNTTLVDLEGLSSLRSVGGTLQIIGNSALTSLDGLSALTSVKLLSIKTNAALSDLGGLSSLTSVPTLTISDNDSLTDLYGLSALESVSVLGISENDSLATLRGISGITSLGALGISNNDALINLSGIPELSRLYSLTISDNDSLSDLGGLSTLTSIDTSLTISNNSSLVGFDGISALTSVSEDLLVSDNVALADLNGLSSVKRVGVLFVRNNAILANCDGIVTLVDPIDDFELGPGPGPAGIPDVANFTWIRNNAKGCNSVNEILGKVPLYRINAGLNDAWFNFETNGQGFLIMVFPEIKQIFMAWFTYDTERPPVDVTAILGEPGHRWLTAQGEYIDNIAELTLYVSAGGVFDAEEPKPETLPYGEILLEFSTCNAGTVTYDIPSIFQMGSIPIERIALDNVPLCYLLNNQALDSE
jgi:hypothetical protein